MKQGGSSPRSASIIAVVAVLALCVGVMLGMAISANSRSGIEVTPPQNDPTEMRDIESSTSTETASSEQSPSSSADAQDASKTTGGETADDGASKTTDSKAQARKLAAKLNLTKDMRSSFVHGKKGAKFQKYIVLHDTEGGGSPESVVDMWDGNGNLIAAHFVVGKDGSIVQCVPMDKIAHHAGFGDTGHNKKFGVSDESRDDKKGTTPIGSDYADYGMNSYSIGIEMIHVGGEGDYPKAQLKALDKLIAYIDAYYGFESKIIDHKTWRTTNSDTSREFAKYLANYKKTRTHDGT